MKYNVLSILNYKIILILSFTLLFSCCKDDDDNTTPTNPIDLLPPATQIGANTAGCLVDGEIFLPTDNLVLNFLDGENFQLGLSNRNDDDLFDILISLDNIDIQLNESFLINTEFSNNTRTGEYVINVESPPSPNYYSTTSSVTGELTITYHDFDNAFMSGTFWFDAVNSNGEIVEIRDGRFDVQY